MPLFQAIVWRISKDCFLKNKDFFNRQTDKQKVQY